MTIFVLFVLAAMIVALIKDCMRPGMILFSVVVVFLCAGLLTPKECIEGFSNKGMITVALLFLVSEGVRRSGVLQQLLAALLPKNTKKSTGSITATHIRLMPIISAFSAFLNNTPVVVIFAPMIKNWARRMGLAPAKFLIPLSYATILGGICTLIGTSTNLVVNGMVEDAGLPGFSLFELGKVGGFICIVGLTYITFLSRFMLPNHTAHEDEDEKEERESQSVVRIEAVLSSRFPGLGKTLAAFDFKRHYGATVRHILRGGQKISENLDQVRLQENDTLVLDADSTFVPTWGESRVFIMLSVSESIENKQMSNGRRWLAMGLLVFMIIGATVGELPVVEQLNPPVRLDMFFFACVTTVLMAWAKLFPAHKYTKFISWDVLITIACAFAISKAMSNSGFADNLAEFIIGLTRHLGPYAILAVIFIITNLFTELITNNAAAALSFPIAMAVAQHLGVSPTPFFVVICMAASASFCTPIGYQTNLIVQGVGGYKFTDFVKVGLPLNIIAFILSVVLTPLFFPF